MQANLSAPSQVGALELALRAMAWAALTLIGFAASFVGVGLLASQLEQATGMSHSVMLGLWALFWVPTSSLLALVAARVTVGTPPAVRALAWVVVVLGALASAAHVWAVADWSISRYGFSDPDYIGPTFALFAAVAATAVAGFEVQVAPRRAIWLPFVALVGVAAQAIAIISRNLPGLADGLGRDSGPLAVATVAAGLYIGAVGVISIGRLRRG